MLQYPVGESDFKTIVESKKVFVDKTLFIKELIDDGTPIPLLLRPRRFGKSMNLSMLNYFFSLKFKNSASLFQSLQIAKIENGNYLQYQGKYPVISFTLKDIKPSTYADAHKALRMLIRNIYSDHDYLLKSDCLKDIQKDDFKQILTQVSDIELLKQSLKNLIQYLYQHHNKMQDPDEAKAKPISEQQKIIVLIDEYDAPILSAYEHNYYEEMIEFMRSFIGSGLKDNPYIFKGVLTGILRISQANLFSGANNIIPCTVLSNDYSKYFGFTQEEVTALIQQTEYEEYLDKVQTWYNGYQFGDLTIYNPWSIMNYLRDIVKKSKKPALFDPYWVNVSNNVLIEKSLQNASIGVKEKFLSLLQGKSVTCDVNEHSVFENIEKDTPALWGLLVFSGYLTVVRRLATEENSSNLFFCEVKLPNREVRGLFDQLTQKTLKAVCEDDNGYSQFIKSLTEGDVKQFTLILQRYLKETASYHEFSKKSDEVVYHAFILGVVVGLRDRYTILSNRESGDGRYDVAFYPKANSQIHRGIILEFKATEQHAQLQKEAQGALQQVQQREYYTDMQANHSDVKEVLMIGIAFCGKDIVVKHQILLLKKTEATTALPLLQSYSEKLKDKTMSLSSFPKKRKLSSDIARVPIKKAKVGDMTITFNLVGTKKEPIR